ncbi:hypothetical protein T11_8350 [Trichinella zimbabwensis]|uniref:Uncharacterized protein n=1 Tax=Trichinella zimbabwensis TaxID=268475 RepID=A0A0V1I897_9BILA|nr:hypothetical protein T11_8350 [Trichinella zimbabwensis]
MDTKPIAETGHCTKIRPPTQSEVKSFLSARFNRKHTKRSNYRYENTSIIMIIVCDDYNGSWAPIIVQRLVICILLCNVALKANIGSDPSTIEID